MINSFLDRWIFKVVWNKVLNEMFSISTSITSFISIATLLPMICCSNPRLTQFYIIFSSLKSCYPLDKCLKHVWTLIVSGAKWGKVASDKANSREICQLLEKRQHMACINMVAIATSYLGGCGQYSNIKQMLKSTGIHCIIVLYYCIHNSIGVIVKK